MENNANSKQFGAPQLCAKCCAFYANPQFDNYCSKCFKELNLNSAIQKQNEKVETETSIKNIEVEQQTTIQQADHSVCWSCTKKTGMMGYKCKCEYTFCKKHRLPENHSCEYDFVSEGKKILAKANPNMQHDKIERI